MPDRRDYRGVKLIISRATLIAHANRHLDMDVYPYSYPRRIRSFNAIEVYDRRQAMSGSGQGETTMQDEVDTPNITLQYLCAPL